MLDYIPFTKGQENEIKVASSIVGGHNSMLKNQKFTLKFLQNKQNYAKINKVTDYQSLLNSPEQITTRSLDIQQYEYILRKNGSEYRLKDYKISKGQQINLTRKQQQQSIQVENVHLNENSDHQKKLELALNRSKFNRVGSIGDTQRSQDSLSSIQIITRYQQLQQSNQYLVLQQQDEHDRQISNQQDQSSNSSINFEHQIVDITNEKNEETILNDSIDNKNYIHKEIQQQVENQEQYIQINESYAISQFSCPQQQSINNEITLINYDDEEEDNEEENEEQIQFDKKQIKNKNQPRQKQQKQQQQSNSKTNQSIQSVKKSDNKISRQQSQMSLSDLDRIEQIIQQNENDLDEAEVILRDKMKQQIRDLEDKIQKTKERQEQFQYNSEDYKDKSGEYLQTKKMEQQIQQEQQQNQVQQHQSKKQGKNEFKQSIQTQSIISKQPKQIKLLDTQSQAVLPNINQQLEHPIIIKSPKQEKKNLDINQNESKRISQHSIELEKSVIESQKDLEKQQNNSVPIVTDPLIKIENRLKEIQEDMEIHQRKQSEVDFADFLLTSGNVFDKNYEKYKIFQFDKQSEDPPGNFREEDINLYHQMKYWDTQNTGNNKKILSVADFVRGVYTKFTSEANICEEDIKTQKSIDSDWE